MTKVVGLTGGIGSGKSTITDILKHHVPVIDTDVLARQVVQPGSIGLRKVIALFGEQYLLHDGTLNRQLLRQKIFSDLQAKQDLESILHPLIQNETLRLIKEYQKQSPLFIIVAIPLLVESILKNGKKPDYIDQIWVVNCSKQQQLERAASRDGLDKELISNIMKQQATQAQRIQYADKVIENNGSKLALTQTVNALLSHSVE